MTLSVSREQVQRFRLARRHLARRLGAGEASRAAVAGLQDTPPGSAAVALAARADGATLEDHVVIFGPRGAPHAVAPEDVSAFTAGRYPPDEESARAMIGSAWQTLEGIEALDAVDRVSDAVADSLAGGPLARDDFHQALRERLPGELLWWCRGCGSHHVHPSLWRQTGARGVLAVTGREGRVTIFGAPPRTPRSKDPGADLARRYLHCYAPADPKLFGWWAGITTGHAAQLWDRAGDLCEVDLGGERRWALAEDADALAGADEVAGVRLLPNLDPTCAARDRELLFPDAAVRKRVFKALGGPGLVLVDGEVRGLWRPAKKGKRLVVTVEALGKAIPAEALDAEAQRLAPLRGAERAEVVSAG